MPKTIINDSKFQRRMDSLARVLAPSFQKTPCIAVAFVEDMLFITFNTPRNKVKDGDSYNTKEHSVDDIKEAAAEVKEIIKGKLDLLREFLYQFKPYKAQKSAIDYSHLLQEAGGLGISRKIDGKGKKHSTRQRLITDLIKLAEFYRNSPCFNPETGFNKNHIHALMESQPSLAYPKVKKELDKKGKLHAEQLIMSKIKNFYREKNIKHFKVTIGINKLVCQTCELVLNQEADKFSYRGRSGLQYPKTINTITKKISELYHPTAYLLSNIADTSPDDSHSEPESVGTFNSKSKYSSASFFELSSKEKVHQKNRNKHINQRTISIKS